MNEDFVTYEIAQALKKAGFDWPCRTYWMKTYIDKDIMTLREDLRASNHNEYAPDYYSAPTLAQAQKWLREAKGIAINVCAHDRGCYTWDVTYLPTAPEYKGIIHVDLAGYDTYESALSAGIAAALKLVEEGKK